MNATIPGLVGSNGIGLNTVMVPETRKLSMDARNMCSEDAGGTLSESSTPRRSLHCHSISSRSSTSSQSQHNVCPTGGDMSVSSMAMPMGRSGVIGSDWNVAITAPNVTGQANGSSTLVGAGTVDILTSASSHSSPRSVRPTSPSSIFVTANSGSANMALEGSRTTSPAGASSTTAFSPPSRSGTSISMTGSTFAGTTGGPVCSSSNTTNGPMPLHPHHPHSRVPSPVPTPASLPFRFTTSIPSFPYSASSSGSLTPNVPVPSSPGSGGKYCLTNLAPRSTILHILGLFFDFVWPLTPCIHRTSFYHDLGEKREERDPLFFALVCSTISSTLVQVPRSYLTMDRDEVRSLARRFNDASNMASVFSYDLPTSTMVIIKYFDNIYYFREGKEGASNAVIGEAMYIATHLRMHEEDSYDGLDYIEREMRRRAFWLLFGADKTICVISRRPCALRLEDCTVRLPTEVDDEFITPRAILPQPPNKTSIISGFNYISKIFRLIAEIISVIRSDTHKPPSGAGAVARLDQLFDIHRRIISLFNDAPPELCLQPYLRNMSPGSSGLPPLDLDASGFGDLDGAVFAQAAIAEVNQLFDNPNANREDAGNAFLVMQANIYVTQHMARLMAEQHRHELVMNIRLTGYDLTLVHSPAVAAEITRGGWTADDREAVARDLLHVLRSIPILSIATNGPSLVHKVRFVASTLLDSIREAETAPIPASRALSYLWNFLSILTEIERNYSLGEEAPARNETSITGR